MSSRKSSPPGSPRSRTESKRWRIANTFHRGLNRLRGKGQGQGHGQVSPPWDRHRDRDIYHSSPLYLPLPLSIGNSPCPCPCPFASVRVGTASRQCCIEVGTAPRAVLVVLGRADRLGQPRLSGPLNPTTRQPPIPRIRINDARWQGNRVIITYYETAYPGLLVDSDIARNHATKNTWSKLLGRAG